jgi:ribosomal protein S18 acetylase RimI-like enzyme
VLDVVVRAYRPADRGRVREICFLTGYMGEPADWFWRDRESFADMFSGYYTDREPESASVVEIDGVVSGYLLGCVDSTKAWNPANVAGRHIVQRGIAFRPGTARVIWRTIRDGLGEVVRRRHELDDLEFSDPRYPAHLHIDLLPNARGVGAGTRLMHRWLDRLRASGVQGCHLQTMAENTSAIAFFTACGFEPAGGTPRIPGVRSRTGGRLHSQAMVQSLR